MHLDHTDFFDAAAAFHAECDKRTAPEVSSNVEEIPTPSKWAETALGFKPDAKQTAVLDHDAHRLILCCARQWGKTTIIGIKALHTAIFQPGSEIMVISKSLKQAGILLDNVRQSAAILG